MAAGNSNPQLTTGWTNQQEYVQRAFLDTDRSGINQGTVTLADLVAGVQTSLGKADTAIQAADVNKYSALNQWLLNGSPTGTLRSNITRAEADENLAALTTQVMTSVAIPLYAGDVVTNLTFISGATPAGTPTNWWFALYSSAATPALLAQTADQTSTAWGANTAVTLALSAPQTITTTGVYYAAVMVKATTPPTLAGTNILQTAVAGAVVTGMKVLANTSGTTLTTTAPATIATPTTIGTVPFVLAN